MYRPAFIFKTLMASLALLLRLASAQNQPVIAENFPIKLLADRILGNYACPTLSDLDQNGSLDILVASGKTVHAIRSEGSALPGWPQTTAFACRLSPVVGDLNGDGSLEVITFDQEGLSRKTNLYAWDAGGNIMPGFPVKPGFGEYAVALFDMDGDGKPEIIGNFDQKCHVIRHDGTTAPGWPQNYAPYYPASKAAAGDIDNDGSPEIVFAALDSVHPSSQQARGRLYAFRASGELLAGWPITMPTGYNFWSGCDPTLVDVDHNGTLEIAVGTTRFRRRDIIGFAALFRHDGSFMPGWPQYTADADTLSGFEAGPSAADLDGDGFPELIFGDRFDHIAAWKAEGQAVPGWPVKLTTAHPGMRAVTTYSNPTIGDIDGDARLEIMTDNNQANLINGVWLGHFFAFNHDATPLSWSPLRPREIANGSAALADLENDGTLELVTLSAENFEYEAWLTVWEVPGVAYAKERFPWPVYGHDRWHTSQYGFVPPDEPALGVAGKSPSQPRPESFVLQPNFPNPFTPAAEYNSVIEIRYELPEAAGINLRVFNVLGHEVRKLLTAAQPAGAHHARWNGRDQHGRLLPAGVYFVRVEAIFPSKSSAPVSRTQKLLLL